MRKENFYLGNYDLQDVRQIDSEIETALEILQLLIRFGNGSSQKLQSKAICLLKSQKEK